MSCVSGLTVVAVLDVLLVVAAPVPILPAIVAVDWVGAGDVNPVSISPAKAENERAIIKTVAATVSLRCFIMSPEKLKLKVVRSNH